MLLTIIGEDKLGGVWTIDTKRNISKWTIFHYDGIKCRRPGNVNHITEIPPTSPLSPAEEQKFHELIDISEGV